MAKLTIEFAGSVQVLTCECGYSAGSMPKECPQCHQRFDHVEMWTPHGEVITAASLPPSMQRPLDNA
ncbi:hypothetical protein AB4Y89_06095 [Terriglobus sp. 2YAB30_2]|uniref:hypothetical protein n=1 Tax=Terriglobus sp. 2YAB30_2 TaxID=3233023 RepID=UPI003F974069